MPPVFGPFTIDVPPEGDFPGGSAPMPESTPFGLAMMLWQIHEQRGAVDLGHAEIEEAARLAFGRARVEEWLGQGVTHDALEVALDAAVTEYGRRRSEEAALAAQGRRLLAAEARRLIEEASA